MPQLCPVVQWSVHWAPSQMTQVLVLAVPLRHVGKKMQAPLLGLAKSIYYEFLTNLNGPYKIHLVAIRELFN